MKRLLLLLLLAVALGASATSKDTLNAVSMVDFVQDMTDLSSKISLRNNTDEDIHNVQFRITYSTPKGTALDYRDFSKSVNIAPGKIKQIEIQKFGDNGNYVYVKSKDRIFADHPFKVKFEVTGYNHKAFAIDVKTPAESNRMSFGGMTDNSVIMWFLIILLINVMAGMYAIVAAMAREYHFNVVLWLFISLLFTPLVIMIILPFVNLSITNRFYRRQMSDDSWDETGDRWGKSDDRWGDRKTTWHDTRDQDINR